MLQLKARVIPESDQVQRTTAIGEISGDRGEILRCVVLAMTSVCEGVDDSPAAEDTHAYQMRYSIEQVKRYQSQITGLRLRNGVPIAELLTT